MTSGNAGWEILVNCLSESPGPFLSCDMKWKPRKATCHSQWIDVILFSRTLIDVHVGWISSATHDPDKPNRRCRWYWRWWVNAAAQRIGAGARERQSIHVVPAEFINETSGRRSLETTWLHKGGRRTHTHMLHAGRSVPQHPPSRFTCSTVYFCFYMYFNILII